MYSIVLKKKAKKFIDSLDINDKRRISDALNKLPNDGDIKKIKGRDNLYRLRVGTYRIIYTVDHDNLIVLVINIGNRGEIYKHKKNNRIIQIDSFAFHMNERNHDDSIIVYKNIEKHGEYQIGSSICWNGYGTKEEIENEFELLVSQDDLCKYKDWNDIFKLAEV